MVTALIYIFFFDSNVSPVVASISISIAWAGVPSPIKPSQGLEEDDLWHPGVIKLTVSNSRK
jgi:hypothetical protein